MISNEVLETMDGHFDIFPKEIIDRITGFLSYLDIMSLSFTCKLLNIYVSVPDIRRMIIDKFSKFLSDDPEIFMDYIDKFNMTIAGSFMLNLITNPEWKNNDIDLFFNMDEYIDSEDNKYAFHMKSQYQMIENRVFQVNYYKDIQVIYFKHIKSLDYVFKSFDTDLYKVAYNKGKLYIKNWNIFFKKEFIIYPTSLYIQYIYGYKYDRSSHNPYKDYLDFRKFKTNFTNQEIDIILNHTMKKTQSRLKKYQERGFNISLHPKVEEIVKYEFELYNKYFPEGPAQYFNFTLLDDRNIFIESLDQIKNY